MDTIGEIRLFAGDYAPDGWVICDGRALNISDYQTMFDLIGTTYGGDGQSYFNVPDLQSRVPIGAGQGAGLPNYNLGETGGTEKNTLTIGNIPAHNHHYQGFGVLVSSEDGHRPAPVGNYPAVNGQNMYSTTADSQMAQDTLTVTIADSGVAAPAAINNLQPYLSINYIICCNGIYPTH